MLAWSHMISAAFLNGDVFGKIQH